MQQLFAQVAEIYESGEQWWLTREEETMLEAQNKFHGRVSLIREQLMDIIDFNKVGQANLPAMTASQILKFLPISNPSNSTFKEIHNVLREFLGPPKRINGNMTFRFPTKDHGQDLKEVFGHEEEIY